MNISRFALLLSLSSILMLVVGCASSAKIDANMDTWLGSDIDELIASWGPPESMYQHSSGSYVYTWTARGESTVPSHTATNTTYISGDEGDTAIVQTTTTAGGTVRFVCQRSFATTQEGEIFAHESKGNGCYQAKAKEEVAVTQGNPFEYW